MKDKDEKRAAMLACYKFLDAKTRRSEQTDEEETEQIRLLYELFHPERVIWHSPEEFRALATRPCDSYTPGTEPAR